ncbi:MAG: Gfo/Idh/MocA family oxidoreductase [Lachnospiraceae bacterium]|nr:Gfo/Idh/MocA family oxidoreductase [Lachnospiraceae bacterium]
MKNTKKYRFVLIGAGWRAAYYIRIAKALPEIFELCAVYCRSEEKAQRIRKEYDVNAVTSEEECMAYDPDFVVVSVSKMSGAEVSMKWTGRGYTVIQETPAGMDIETLNKLRERSLLGEKLVVAEQYTRYPKYDALIKVIKSGIIGEVTCLNISLANDHHGASLIRNLLGIPVDMGFTVSSKVFSFATTETMTRYEEYHDGRVADKKRRIATFEFDNGAVALYDFDSEQYRSPIRHNTYKVQGIRGEIIDDTVYWLDEANQARKAQITVKSGMVETGNPNPNFARICETERVIFNGEVLYEAPFGLCGLTDDETAIAGLMEQAGEYARGNAQSPYPLKEALQDAYMAIKMEEAGKVCRTGMTESAGDAASSNVVSSAHQVWMK